MAKWQEIEAKQMVRLLQKVEGNYNDHEAKEPTTRQKQQENTRLETNVDGATLGMSK